MGASYPMLIVFFQAEDGIRDLYVTGVQTCALPIFQAGRDDLAGSFAVQLEQLRGALARTQGQLATAKTAFDKAAAVKQAFMREKDRKTQEALNAIRDYRRAQWQKKVADSMESFEVAGISQTHDEMVRKVEEMTAVNEARMDMAMGNVDQQGLKIEEEVEQLRAAELVKQFKAEMGLASPAPSSSPEKTLGGKEGQRTS